MISFEGDKHASFNKDDVLNIRDERGTVMEKLMKGMMKSDEN